MTTLPIGTVKTQFNRSYVLTNPFNNRNIYEWRPTNVPTGEDAIGIIGIPPIMSSENVNTGAVTVSFSISALSEIDTKAKTAYITDWVVAARSDKRFLPNLRNATINIEGEEPIMVNQNRNIAVLNFDPSSLEAMSLHGPKTQPRKSRESSSMNVALRSYNRDNAVVLSATAPMAESTIGDNTTFSFDISALSSV